MNEDKLNKFLDIGLKIYRVIKPSFHNKVTWVLIFFGISLMSSSLLEDFVNHVLKKQFDFTVTGEKDVFWGFMLCLIALIYNIILNIIGAYNEKANRQERKEQQDLLLEHDRKLYQKLEPGLKEQYLHNIIVNTATDHAIYWNQVTTLEAFVSVNKEAGNKFLSPEISSATKKLVEDIDNYLRFQNEHFDAYPYHQREQNIRLCLAPQWNVDRAGRWEDGDKYDPLADEMLRLLRTMGSAYTAWRAAVKRVLFI